jgi:hypothetical protein
LAGHLDGVYHTIKITSNSTSTFSYVDGSLYKDCYPPQYTPNALNSLYGYTYKAGLAYASITYIDYWMVAKHYSPEPTYTIGAEEIFGYVIEFTKFAGGNETITLHGNATTSFTVSPEITYTESKINLTGTQASPYPLNPKVYVGNTLIFNYSGNYSGSQIVSFNVSIINDWFTDHPSGEVPVITLMDNAGGMLMTDLYVKSISPTPVTYCDGSEYYDPVDKVCRKGSTTMASTKDKNYYAFRITTTLSNWYSTDPFRWERENQSLPVYVSADFHVPEHTLNINETNARRVYIDFNKVSQYTKYDIWNSLLTRKDFYLRIMGDGTNDYYVVGIPSPKEIFKDNVVFTNWNYNSITKTITINNVAMSPHEFTFVFGEATEVRQDFILGGILPLLIGIGLLLFVVTTAFSLGETQSSDPKEALKEILANVIGIVVILIVVATALTMYLGLPL